MSIITFRAKSNIRNSNVTNCSPQQKACHSAPRIYNNLSHIWLQMQSKSTAADSVEHRYTSVQKCYVQSLYNRKNKIPGLSQVSDKMDYRVVHAKLKRLDSGLLCTPLFTFLRSCSNSVSHHHLMLSSFSMLTYFATTYHSNQPHTSWNIHVAHMEELQSCCNSPSTL